jgi:hypothetical protein
MDLQKDQHCELLNLLADEAQRPLRERWHPARRPRSRNSMFDS